MLLSCWPRTHPDPKPQQKVFGYKPVYTTDSSILRITADTARAVKNAGKIYVIGNLILQNEIGAGVHVLDKTIPSQIKNIGFITIKGNTEISIKEGFLYANSFADLVVINITNWRQPAEVKRIKNAFAQGNNQPGFYNFIPLPEHNVYWDCTSTRAGFQTGWVKDSIYDNCYYR